MAIATKDVHANRTGNKFVAECHVQVKINSTHINLHVLKLLIYMKITKNQHGTMELPNDMHTYIQFTLDNYMSYLRCR